MRLARAVLGELGLPAEVTSVEVRTPEEAQRLRFLGSPSVRVEGSDIEPGAEARVTFALCCRLYTGAGLPPRALLVGALEPHRSAR